jgi:hypothetical protein
MTYRTAYPVKELLSCELPAIPAVADTGILLKCTQNTDITVGRGQSFMYVVVQITAPWFCLYPIEINN